MIDLPECTVDGWCEYVGEMEVGGGKRALSRRFRRQGMVNSEGTSRGIMRSSLVSSHQSSSGSLTLTLRVLHRVWYSPGPVNVNHTALSFSHCEHTKDSCTHHSLALESMLFCLLFLCGSSRRGVALAIAALANNSRPTLLAKANTLVLTVAPSLRFFPSLLD